MYLDIYERLLIKSGSQRYKVMGPGQVLMYPWRKALTTFDVGPQSQPFQFKSMRAQGDIPLSVTLRVSYRVNPSLFNDDLLPRIPALSEGGWQEMLQWQVEAVLQRSLPGFSWRDLGQEETQTQFERRFSQALAERLKGAGLEIMDVALVKAELPEAVQRDILRAERGRISARRRAETLREYVDVFDENELTKIMPYIAQMESSEDNGHQQPPLLSPG